MKIKKIFSALIPRKVTISVDNIKAPCYNGYITGGIILSKEKNELAEMEKFSNLSCSEISEGISSIATAITEISECHGNTELSKIESLAKIAGDTEKPEPIRMEAIKTIGWLGAEEQKTRRHIHTVWALAGTVSFTVLCICLCAKNRQLKLVA